MKIRLIIINDAPYGSERMYNGLRLLVRSLSTKEPSSRSFLSAMRFQERTKARKCRRATTTCR
jgi:sulfur relay (sulfurtransferase) DsrF/TusC family protein